MDSQKHLEKFQAWFAKVSKVQKSDTDKTIEGLQETTNLFIEGTRLLRHFQIDTRTAELEAKRKNLELPAGAAQVQPQYGENFPNTNAIAEYNVIPTIQKLGSIIK